MMDIFFATEQNFCAEHKESTSTRAITMRGAFEQQCCIAT